MENNYDVALEMFTDAIELFPEAAVPLPEAKNNFKTALENLKQKTLADFYTGKLNSFEAINLANSTYELAKCVATRITDSDIVKFENETDQFRTYCGWEVVLDAVIGAALSVVASAIVSFCCPPVALGVGAFIGTLFGLQQAFKYAGMGEELTQVVDDACEVASMSR